MHHYEAKPSLFMEMPHFTSTQAARPPTAGPYLWGLPWEARIQEIRLKIRIENRDLKN